MDAAVAAVRALLDDPNLRFPERPRVIEDVRVFRLPDGLGVQFRFGEAPITLRGREADRVLDFLLPRLDGTRTVDDLLTEATGGLAPVTILKTLVLLHRKGVLTRAAGADGVPPNTRVPADEALRRQLLFWGRHLDLTRAADSAGEVQRRLSGCRVAIVATGVFGALTCDLLARSGVGALRVLAWDDDGLLAESLAVAPVRPLEVRSLDVVSPEAAAAPLREWLDDTDLLVTATRNAPAELFRRINRICLQHGRGWLRGNADATRIDVGPYVDPFRSACFACLELRERSMQPAAVDEQLYQDDLARPRAADETLPLGEALFGASIAAGLLVGEVVRIATGFAMPTLVNAVATVLPVSGTVDWHTLLRVPRCPECFRGAVAPPAATGPLVAS
jgi:bacteriocin biosynthesis cyclodehydratase domain-containing protein